MQRLGSEKLFEGKLFDVGRQRHRRADGSEVEREVVEHPGSVAIVAHDERVVYLVRQPREAVEADRLLEIPAGTIEPGEGALACAKRELAEEVGLAAERWSELHTILTSPGYLDESLTIFLATGLSQVEANPDDDEQIEIVQLPIGEIASALPGILDAKTLIALMLLRDQVRR